MTPRITITIPAAFNQNVFMVISNLPCRKLTIDKREPNVKINYKEFTVNCQFSRLFMFTGLIEAVCTVKSVRQAATVQIIIDLGHLADQIKTGDSIAVNGVCLKGTWPTKSKPAIV
jgi:hypothetical protein